MPDIRYNQEHWNDIYAWSEDGDEWSRPWGTPYAQWSFCILPRIHSFLFGKPAILEIATGRGRWTERLVPYCSTLHGIDISQKCIEFCKQRFRDFPNVNFTANDGASLDMIADGSIDFVFSFDSLVHVEMPVMEAYVKQIARKLKPSGVAFLHHSNLGEYREFFKDLDFIPYPEQRLLMKKGLLTNDNGRGRDVTADGVAALCSASKLRCQRQEIVSWGGELMMDCFTTIVHEDSARKGEREVLRNDEFMTEARLVAKLSSLYTS